MGPSKILVTERVETEPTDTTQQLRRVFPLLQHTTSPPHSEVAFKVRCMYAVSEWEEVVLLEMPCVS